MEITRNVMVDGKFIEEWIAYRNTLTHHDPEAPLIDGRIALAMKFATGGDPLDQDAVIIETTEIPNFPAFIPDPCAFKPEVIDLPHDRWTL